LERGAQVIVTIDADGQMNPEEIKNLCEPILSKECDVVLGSRFGKQGSEVPFIRKCFIRLAATLFSFVWGFSITDSQNGFRAFSRKAALKIKITQNRMAHATEILYQIRKHKLQFREVPVKIRYTSYSLSKGQKLINILNIIQLIKIINQIILLIKNFKNGN
jgi:glycosyltransferase involved in cell wall biosynthesis